MLIPLRENLSGLVAAGKKLRESKFARDAAWLLLFNFIAKALSFFGGAYAARCLGPLNLGVSALVQTTGAQAALVYNGGLDPVAVRRIAADKTCAGPVTAAVITFRMVMAVVVYAAWCAVVLCVVPGPRQSAWLVGGLLMVTSASSVVFAFQGLEKLPVQNAIAAGTSLLMAVSYFSLFKPGMPLGSDLYVLASVGLLSSAVSWWFYCKASGTGPLARPDMKMLSSLFGESWRYWLLALVSFFYTLFQFPLINYFLGERSTGVYRSAWLMASGLEMLFGSITALLLPRMVVWKQESGAHLRAQQGRLLKIFLLVGLPLTGALMLASPFIYHVFFGPAYLGGIHIFQVLAAGRLVVFIGQIYIWGAVAAGLDKEFLLITICGAVFSVAANAALLPAYGLAAAAAVSVATELIIGGASYAVLCRAVPAAGAKR